MLALHYVYLPRINRVIDIFREGWNNHRIRAAQHTSPRQLFVSGALRLQNSGLAALDFFDNVDDSYGMVNENVSPDQEEEGSVIIPEFRIRLSPEHLETLQQHVNPLSMRDDRAVGKYESTANLLRTFFNS